MHEAIAENSRESASITLGLTLPGRRLYFGAMWSQIGVLRRPLKVALVLLALVGPLVIMPSIANAYTFHGCKYDGTDPAISYRYYSVGATYQTAFDQGQYAWDVTSVPGYFYSTTGSDPMINVEDGSYSGSDWAVTSFGCDGDGTYTSNEVTVRMDIVDMAGLTAYEKKLVLIHELGHAYGLGHSGTGCADPRVMSQGSTKFGCGGTPPWSNDQAGVNARY